jgi:hypothetical protein
MAKLALNAAPTFRAKVSIPVAGGPPVDVEMTFRHRTKTQLDEFVKSREGKTDTESFMEMVSAWDLEDPFSVESVSLLLENYIGAALAAYRKYLDELVQAKLGN